MKTSDIRQKLHQYIDTAQEKKVKVIFAMVEEIEEADDHWQDEEFINELKRRENNYLVGTSKTYTLQQSVARAKKAVKKVKTK